MEDTADESVWVYVDGNALGLDLAETERLCRERALKILQTVVRERPGSIRETARLVDRDVHAVHTDLRELEGIGVINFTKEGRARRPQVPYDDLHIEVDLSE